MTYLQAIKSWRRHCGFGYLEKWTQAQQSAWRPHHPSGTPSLRYTVVTFCPCVFVSLCSTTYKVRRRRTKVCVRQKPLAMLHTLDNKEEIWFWWNELFKDLMGVRYLILLLGWVQGIRMLYISKSKSTWLCVWLSESQERLSTAVQLHFILCPFPNQFQFGLEKNSKFWRLVFQTNSSLVWKKITILTIRFPNQFQFGLEKMTTFRKQKIPN